MESYAELEVIVQPFIVSPLERAFHSDYHVQKSVPSDRKLAGGGALAASLHKVVGGKNTHSCQKLIPSDSFYKTLTCT
jgi:hypothetical protein